jgi:hypothetical protein
MGVYQREAGLFVDCTCPAVELTVDEARLARGVGRGAPPMLPRS